MGIQMTGDYENLKEDIQEIKGTVRDIFIILNGNGKDGLCTRVSLNKAAIGRIWWWLGGVSLGILGIAVFVIRGVLNQ
uniref:Uncharacterized protein n=1 Tax=viral metagenome TaxID=1070528 RepID=A0A6H2A3B1_9ZZZZ